MPSSSQAPAIHGTLEPGRLPPDVHIFTSTRLPWVVLPEGVPVFEEYYSTKKQWPVASLERRKTLVAKLKAGG
jgi:hypothetical protein